MLKTTGFILMVMNPGFVAKYDDVTGSKTGIFETASDCLRALKIYYEYTNTGSLSCAAVMVKE